MDLKKILIALLIFLVTTEIEHHTDILSKLSEKLLPQAEVNCLIKNAYHESYGEGALGMAIVTQVVINRAKATGESLCQTVFKYKQFSWTLFKEKEISEKAYLETQSIVLGVYYGFIQIPSVFENATHFHTIHVKPYWRKGVKRLGILKNHIFYEDQKLRKN